MPQDKFYATKSNKRLHRWGFKDSGFELTGEKTVIFSGDRYEVSGTEMPDFIPYIDIYFFFIVIIINRFFFLNYFTIIMKEI